MRKFNSKFVQHLIPLAILIPYVAYCLHDRFAADNVRKIEMKAEAEQRKHTPK